MSTLFTKDNDQRTNDVPSKIEALFRVVLVTTMLGVGLGIIAYAGLLTFSAMFGAVESIRIGLLWWLLGAEGVLLMMWWAVR